MFDRLRVLVPVLFATLSTVACASETEAGDDDAPNAEEEDLGSAAEALSASRARAFADANEVTLSPSQRQAALARWSRIDHDGVREELFQRAVLFFDRNRATIRNTRWLGIVDFGQHSREQRFVVLDMEGGPARSFVVAHGSGSDPNHDGRATSFSNVPNSKQSSLGFYEAAETYTGKHGLSMRLDGLSTSNSNARRRAIVLHSAAYVNEGSTRQGRSQGCLAVDAEDRRWILANMKNGAIIYAAR